MNNFLISIITPAFNMEQYISKCINSVLSQKFSNFEFIIIDDGSEDGTLSICKEFEKNDNRIIVLESNNYGVSVARNMGLNKARGDYVYFLDADDWIEDDELLSSIELVDSETDFLYSLCHYRDYDEFYEIKKYDYQYDNLNLIGDLISQKAMGYVWGRLFKLSLIKDFNIRFKENIKMMEDLIFCIEYLINCKKISCKEKPGYHYLQRSGSASKKVSIDRLHNQHLALNFVYKILQDNNLNDNYEKNINEWRVINKISFFRGDASIKRRWNDFGKISFFEISNSHVSILYKILFVFLVLKMYFLIDLAYYLKDSLFNIKYVFHSKK